MSYQYRLYASIDEVDRDAWQAVQRNDPFPFTDLRFLQVLERTLAHQSSCWPLLICDEAGRPAAITCLSLFQVDGSILAGPVIRWVTTRMRRFRPRFFRLPMLICGLPVSSGQSSLVIREEADHEAVLHTLQQAIADVEERERPSLTLAKEFTAEQADQLQELVPAGFLQVENIPMHEFPVMFRDFDDYYQQRSRRHRYNIRKSRQKLTDGGVEVKHLRGIDGALDYLTADVHQLYVNVYNESDTKFEFLPLTFFRELARQLPENAWFTFFIHHDRVVAFSLRIAYRDQVHLLVLGVDYSLNRDFDLYFNVLYEDLDGALRLKPKAIYFGQNSSTVKMRLGCRQSARTMFVRGRGRWNGLIRRFSKYIFPHEAVQSSRLEASEPALSQSDRLMQQILPTDEELSGRNCIEDNAKLVDRSPVNSRS